VSNTDDTYVTGFINGVDHGIRLRADLKKPVVNCTYCGQDHPVEEEEEE
jgi:hypothetical protein